MKRLKLLLAMAALACAIGLTVKYGSTYQPVVEPVREIEEIWATGGCSARRAKSRW